MSLSLSSSLSLSLSFFLSFILSFFHSFIHSFFPSSFLPSWFIEYKTSSICRELVGICIHFNSSFCLCLNRASLNPYTEFLFFSFSIYSSEEKFKKTRSKGTLKDSKGSQQQQQQLGQQENKWGHVTLVSLELFRHGVALLVNTAMLRGMVEESTSVKRGKTEGKEKTMNSSLTAPTVLHSSQMRWEDHVLVALDRIMFDNIVSNRLTPVIASLASDVVSVLPLSLSPLSSSSSPSSSSALSSSSLLPSHVIAARITSLSLAISVGLCMAESVIAALRPLLEPEERGEQMKEVASRKRHRSLNTIVPGFFQAVFSLHLSSQQLYSTLDGVGRDPKEAHAESEGGVDCEKEDQSSLGDELYSVLKNSRLLLHELVKRGGKLIELLNKRKVQA